MKLIKEQLEVEVKRIAELDQKRTQGEWQVKKYEDACHYEDKTNDGYGISGVTYIPDYECPMLCKEDANFIASAPQMAQIIRQLWEERQNGIPIAKLDEMVEVAVKGYFEREDKGYARDTVYDYIKAAINAIKQEAGE